MAKNQIRFEPATPQRPGESAGVPLNDRATAVSLAVILAAVFLAYANTLWFQFVHDDRFQILGNTWLRAWKYFPLYFTRDVWAFEHPVVRGTFYRPIFLVWFRLQYLVFGTHPWGWHLLTVVCHLGVTLLVFFTAAHLLQDRVAALFAALIFGMHPIHADAVAWVSGVSEPLFAFFLLASYLCYLNSREETNRPRHYYAASLVLYALACLSKETAVILPLIICATEVLRQRGEKTTMPWRSLRGAFKLVLPYVAILAVYLVIRVVVLQGFQNTKEAHSLADMFLTWPAAIWFYIRHMIWPAHLNPFYTWGYYTRVDFRNVLLPAAGVVAVGAGLWIWSKRSTAAALATVWLVTPILPALDLRAFIEGHLVHDRYLYLPSFGFAMLVALAIRRIRFGSAKLAGRPAVQVAVVALIGLAMGGQVLRATACYENQTTFITYYNSVKPDSQANLDMAGLLAQQGHFPQAIQMFRQLLLKSPNDWNVNFNLGYAYYLTGNLAEADRYLTHATEIDPSRPDAFFYLGLTKLKMGDLNAATANVQRAVTIRPDADHYHFALGIIFKLQGNLPGALSEFHQEMDLDPADSAAREQAAEIERNQPARPSGAAAP